MKKNDVFTFTALNAEQMYGDKQKAAKMKALFEAELKLDKSR